MEHPRLEIKDLTLVQTIAEQGGVTPAARVLHLSQSAVSHHLARLEERLGVAVFARAGRLLRITDAGKRLVELSIELRARMLEVEREVSRSGPEPRIRLSTQCYTAYHWLPPLLTGFGTRHPNVRISIDIEATRAPIEHLEAGKIDLAISHDPPPRGARHAHRVLFDDPFVVLLPSGHRLAARRRLKPADLEDEVLITYDLPAGALKSAGEKLFRGTQGPRGVERVPLTEAIVQLVRSGRGVSVMSRWAARPYAENGQVVIVDLPGHGRTWRAVYDARSPLRRPIEDLVCEIKARGLGEAPT